MTGSAPFPAPQRSDDAGADADRRFTTLGLDHDQWDYWSEVTRTAFVAMRAAALPGAVPVSGKQGFAASAVARVTGGLLVSTMRADPHEAARTPDLVRRAAGEDFFLTLLTEGSARLRQGDRAAEVGPGDFALVDSAHPYVFRFDCPFRSVVLQIPRALLTSRCAVAEHVTAVPFRTARGRGAFVSPVLRALAEQGHDLGEATAASFMRNLLDLLATACDALGSDVSGKASAVVHRRDLRRAKAYLADRLHDPGLTLLAASHDLGFSLRYLHELFREADTTPRAWLYAQRLDRARAMLSGAGHDAQNVSSIALRVGFKDASHFSRAFKSRFGTSPATYRRTAVRAPSGNV
ncbi:helix-turn-helix domain-containing protein [Streptomyces europaeiscabiei]|uniref:helix-turn-helix domain-containing protein n=1 Tax=Streptomyces europaeiscabiei TaxID=146819 RepID=UPI002E0D71C8|nr:helix-turn-helix domain-containing protein [Streptomyces europaeiscabiei]